MSVAHNQQNIVSIYILSEKDFWVSFTDDTTQNPRYFSKASWASDIYLCPSKLFLLGQNHSCKNIFDNSVDLLTQACSIKKQM